MSFNLVQEEFINSVKSVAKRLGIIKETDDEEEAEDYDEYDAEYEEDVYENEPKLWDLAVLQLTRHSTGIGNADRTSLCTRRKRDLEDFSGPRVVWEKLVSRHSSTDHEFPIE